MRKQIRSGVIGALLLAVALVAAACGAGDDGDVEDGPTIVVGSANFSESALIAEIYAQALEGNGYSVERRLNIGAREIYKPALESGELDLVPEYLGSALSALGGTPTADTEATRGALVEAWAGEGIEVLAAAPAEDKNGIVVRQDTADELGLTTVSDLAPHAASLVFGGPPECPEREFCMIGLRDVYGLDFAEFRPLDVGGSLTVAALEGNEVQVALLFTSDGVISARGFVLLEDDQGLQPAENVTPVIRAEIVEAYGDDLVSLLDRVSAELTTEGLIRLNERVGYDGEDPDEVAAEWLDEHGLI